MNPIDPPTRSIAKALSWRILATATTATLVYVFTGDLTTAVEVGALEVVTKLALYYLHERGWQHLSWGRIRTPT